MKKTPQIFLKHKVSLISECNEYGHLPDNYAGTISEIKFGWECEVWNDGSALTNSGHNYSRNNDGSPEGFWCWLIDPNNGWEYFSCGMFFSFISMYEVIHYTL